MISTKIFTALAVLAVADFASHTVSARPLDTDLVSVKVGYADLDLTGPRGAAVMAARIHNAARAICGDGDVSYTDLHQRQLVKSCIEEVSTRAAAQLGSPMVSASIGDHRVSSVTMAAR